MAVLHKTIAGGVLSEFFNDEKGFREVKRAIVNRDGVTVIENGLLGRYPGFANSITGMMNLDGLQITGSSRFVYPQHMQIEVTDGCNLHCEYCYMNAGLDFDSTIVPWAKLQHVLSQLKEAGLAEIGITGGEATLHPDFNHILAYCARSFELIELITNGTNVAALEEALLNIPPTARRKINLSISFNRWMHEYQRFLDGNHYLGKTIAKIGKYRPIRILATDFTFDRKMYEAVSAELIRQGASTVEYNVAMPVGRGKEVTDALTYTKLKRGAQLESEVGKDEWWPDVWSPNCELVLRHATITPDGSVLPCALFPIGDSASFGNIFEKGTSLFEDPAVYRFFSAPAPPGKACGNCELEQYCNDCIFVGLYGNEKECTYKKEFGAQYGIYQDS